jgi:ATP-binding cassette subfamily C (CFTR/MRP) protein 1
VNGRYKHYTYRWVVQVRGNLVSAIFHKSMTLKFAGAGDKAAISLMSTDVERIAQSIPFVHEFWASLIEVAIAIWLLERLLSYAVIAPLAVVILTSYLAGRIGPRAGATSKAWVTMVQKRVSVTNDYLGGIRAFRMAGLEAIASQNIQNLRVVEVAAAMVSY